MIPLVAFFGQKRPQDLLLFSQTRWGPIRPETLTFLGSSREHLLLIQLSWRRPVPGIIGTFSLRNSTLVVPLLFPNPRFKPSGSGTRRPSLLRRSIVLHSHTSGSFATPNF